MSKNVSIASFADEIVQSMKEYTEAVSEAIARTVDERADMVLEEVKAGGPYHDRTGKYSRGWKKSSLGDRSKTRRVIWNKSQYRRVHLLEFGHAKVNGGRVAAFPHLRPAYDRHALDLPDHIKEIIKRGG